MAVPGGRLPPDLSDRLARSPESFGFLQLARLFALSRSDAEPRPFPAGLRYRAGLTMGFPAAAVTGVSADHQGRDAEALVNLIGTLGASGTLPVHYTEFVIARERQGGDDGPTAIRSFYDLFNHRFAELLAHTLDRGHLALAVERRQERGLERVLNSVPGLGLATARRPFERRAAFRLRELQRYAGLLGRMPRSTQAVRQVLAAVLGVPVSVTPFQGRWIQVPAAERGRLTRGGRFARLGEQPACGARVWDRQGAIRVRIGPLDRRAFLRFLPQRKGQPLKSAPLLQELILFLRYALGAGLDYKIDLVVSRTAISGTRISHGAPATAATGAPAGLPPLLGLTSWLSDRQPRDRDDPVVWAQGCEQLEDGADHG